jgi:multidrug efflux pump subunit AcrA (membrane-fusion protein)
MADYDDDNAMRPDHQLPWPEESDPAKVGEQFADPNSADDRRVGRNFEETNFSGKKHHEPLSQRAKEMVPRNRKVLWWFLIGFAILFVIVVLAGALPRFFRDKDTKDRAKQEKNAKPVVETATVQSSKDSAGLVVPGTMIPLTQAYVYARANGYLKKRFVDIGDHVKKDQLLAIIDAPDIDAQVIQAREQVAQAQQQLEQQKAQLALNTVTVQRYRVLVTKGVFSRQDGDTQEANYNSQVANVAAAQRNVQAYKGNLEHQLALQSYEYVRAPFTGVITERDVDEGALISASGAGSGAPASSPQGQVSSSGGTSQAGQTNNSGSSGSLNTSATSAQTPGSGGPLFGVAQVQKLRILVSVPEGYATAIHVGQRAPIQVQEYAGAELFAEVTRTADSIDANTRTMLTELQIDNTAGKLISGMYAVVTFPPAPGATPPLLISGDAVAIRHDRQMVATVQGGKIKYVPVTLGRDFGSEVEVLTGLKVGDVIVTDVTDDVVDDREVTVHASKGAEKQPQGAPPQSAPPGGNSQYGNQGLTDENLQGKQSQQNQKSSGKGGGQKPSSSESKP